MMGDSFTAGGGYCIAEVNGKGANAFGQGPLHWPYLTIPVDLTLRPGRRSKAAAYDFRSIRCSIITSDQLQLAQSDGCDLGYLLRNGDETYTRQCNLRIPLDLRRLEALEGRRKGGDVEVRLDLTLEVDDLSLLNPQAERSEPAIWGTVRRDRLTAQHQLTIPKSHWAERVLPALGYGKVHLVELPVVAFDGADGWHDALAAVEAAQKLERHGHYDEVVGKCRIALEKFWEYVPKDADSPDGAKIPVLKTSWETKLGKATYNWLNSSLVAVKQATNSSHHRASTNFDRVEAQMLLTITTALLAYAVRSSGGEQFSLNGGTA